MKSILIARVSTEEQKEANNSLPAQVFRLKKYCQGKGMEVVKVFSFDESAYKEHRNDFDEILDFVIGQKEKIAVCFDKVDRLSRNVFDKRVSMLYDKALKDEIELHFVSDGQVINSQLSAVEKFNFSISLGLAKYYSDAISDNVKRAIEQKLRKGEWPGMATTGYKNIDLPDDKHDIIVDDYFSKIVQQIFGWYETQSFSMDQIRIKLQNDFGIKWSKGQVDKILKNPFYYGEMIWKEKIYPHKYPPIISRITFDRVQQIKAGFNKKRFKYAGKPYKYRGLLRCGHCGLSMTPEMHKGHVYYHCTQYNGKHGAKWLTEDSITEQIGNVFKRLQVPEPILHQIVEALKIVHEGKISFRKEQNTQLFQEREIYSKRQEKLYLDRLDGRITDTEYDKFYESFRDKVAEIDTRIAILQEAEDNYYITSKYVLELANRAYDLFKSSEVEERRQLIKLTLQNLRVDDKIVLYDLIKPFDTIIKYADRKLWLPRVDSDHEPTAYKNSSDF